MKKIESVIKKETVYIALWTLVLSVLMQAVFLVVGKWDFKVITGNLLGGGAAVLNFFLMCLGVQSAVEKDERDAKSMIRMSQSLRMFLLLAIAAFGAAFPFFNTWAVLISLFFPRIAIVFRPRFNKDEGENQNEGE